MDLASISLWIEEVTQPEHPYYHPVQVALFAGSSYVSTLCLTSISPKRGMKVAVLAYGISQLITPFFVECFEPYRDITLVPLVGQVLQLTSSLLLTKGIYFLAGQTLSFKEIRQLGIAFLVGLAISRFVLLKFRQQIKS